MPNVALCQNCGWSNPAGAPACERCRAPFAQSAPPGPGAQQPGWGPPQPPGTYYPQQYPAPAPRKGMSTGVLAAIIIAVVLFGGVVVVGVVAAIAIPSLLAARSAANEAGAQANLRELGAAEATYYAAHGRFGTIDELVAASALEPGWSEGAVRNGYRFSVVEVGEETFEFKAEPDPPTNGKRSFNLTEDFVVRAKDGAVAPTGTSGKAVAGG